MTKRQKKLPFIKLAERMAGAMMCRIPNYKGAEVFLKVKFGKDPSLKETADRENVALEVLKGLAVPNRVSIPKGEVARMVKQKHFAHVAMQWAPGLGCWARKFPTHQALALWAFTVEQMVAFHRRDVLYTDFKHNHLRITDDFAHAEIVDFDSCVMVEKKGIYPTQYMVYSPDVSPPEFNFAKAHSERVVVYQMGMFLGALLLKYFHNSDLNEKNLKKIKSRLVTGHARDIYHIFEKCLAPRPVDRIKDLETLFSLIQKVTLPVRTYELWNKMRTPYKDSLAELGLLEPKAPQAKSSWKARPKAA